MGHLEQWCGAMLGVSQEGCVNGRVVDSPVNAVLEGMKETTGSFLVVLYIGKPPCGRLLLTRSHADICVTKETSSASRYKVRRILCVSIDVSGIPF